MKNTKPDEKEKEAVGLECTRCGCNHFYVLYTRPRADGKILRRRECRHCGHKITTYESRP